MNGFIGAIIILTLATVVAWIARRTLNDPNATHATVRACLLFTLTLLLDACAIGMTLVLFPDANQTLILTHTIMLAMIQIAALFNPARPTQPRKELS